MSSVMLYGIVAFVEIVFDEIQSFWLMLSPAEGGCGFSSKEIGIQIAITGVLLIVFQTLLYHKLSDKVGVLHLFRCSLIGLAISLTAYPFTSKLAYDNDGFNWKVKTTIVISHANFRLVMEHVVAAWSFENMVRRRSVLDDNGDDK